MTHAKLNSDDRVLIVDADEAMQRAFTRQGQRWHVDIRAARTFDEAVACLANGWQPTIVLASYRLKCVPGGAKILQALSQVVPDAATFLMSSDPLSVPVCARNSCVAVIPKCGGVVEILNSLAAMSRVPACVISTRKSIESQR